MQYRTGPLQHTPTVVKNLVIINAIILLVKLIGHGQLLGFDMDRVLGLHFPAAPDFRPWQFVTHMFMHGDFWHLFMNMFGLFMLGSPLEYHWGSKRFLNFYLLCGLGGAALNTAVQAWELNSLAQQGTMMANLEAARILYTPMVGASGAIFGILAAFGILYPNVELMIFPLPIPIKAKWFVLLYAGYETYAGYAGLMGQGSDNIAHFAHLGGAIVGALLALLWRRRLQPWQRF